MIRTLLVDDEMPALLKLRSLLLPYGDYEVCGAFTDAIQALEQLEALQPQVAFLDIAMPAINGMDLAMAIHKRLGNQVQIVFVSAYDEYALTAFEVRAADYLLKPVSRARFEQTISRLNETLLPAARAAREPQAPLPQRPSLLVRAFGKLEIEDGARAFGSWHTAKVRELFAFYIHNREQGVYRDTILEVLWPHMPPERALASLNTCNYYLRKELEESAMGVSLRYSSSYYSLDLGGARCDADLFMEALAQSGAITEANIAMVRLGAELYRGPYFEDVKCEWADLPAKRFASDYAALCVAIAAHDLLRGETRATKDGAMRALDVNPLYPEAWKLILACYRQGSDPVGYRHAQDKLQSTYQRLLGAEPPQELREPF